MVKRPSHPRTAGRALAECWHAGPALASAACVMAFMWEHPCIPGAMLAGLPPLAHGAWCQGGTGHKEGVRWCPPRQHSQVAAVLLKGSANFKLFHFTSLFVLSPLLLLLGLNPGSLNPGLRPYPFSKLFNLETGAC